MISVSFRTLSASNNRNPKSNYIEMYDLTIIGVSEARWLSGFGSVVLTSLVLASWPDW